jgi:hypothetical protein
VYHRGFIGRASGSIQWPSADPRLARGRQSLQSVDLATTPVLCEPEWLWLCH